MAAKGFLSEEQVQYLIKLHHRRPYLRRLGHEGKLRELESFEQHLRRDQFDPDEIRQMTEWLEREAEENRGRG